MQIQHFIRLVLLKKSKNKIVNKPALVNTRPVSPDNIRKNVESLNQKMIEAKNKWESEKRRIFAFAADEFRSCYDNSDTLDERSFKSFLGRIKNFVYINIFFFF